MSLPTYVRRLTEPDPVKYLTKQIGGDPALWTRAVQVLKAWKEDYQGYYINPTKKHVRPFWLTPFNVSDQALVLQAAGTPGDTVKLVPFEVDTQGHFELAYAMYVATHNSDGSAANNFTIQIFDGGNNNKGLQNDEIHVATTAGIAKRPFIWPESYFVNTQTAKRTIFMTFRNLDAQAITVRWAFHGRRWYHKEAPANVSEAIQKRFERMEKTYTYFMTLQGIRGTTPEGANNPAVTLSAGEQLIENAAPFFKATDDADAEVHKLTAFSTGPFEFQLRERQSGRILSNGFIHVNTGMGDGQFPFVWSESLLLERNYEILFEVHDLSNAQNIIWPTLTSRRLQYA